jgi:DNA polymerase-3 subunit delta'
VGFDQFLGNLEAVTSLQGMMRSGRVPGSLLFAGPSGVGKRTLAEMMAKALNCERRDDNFCGECSPCIRSEQMLNASREDLARRQAMKDSTRRSEGVVYFDLQLVAPVTRYILTEQARQIRLAAYTRPFEMKRRIFIIDQAQTLHWQAVDLLLKVLEEPPDSSMFILVCPNAQELRSTIRSRCFRVSFKEVEPAVIRGVVEKERKFTGEEAELAVRLASGSVARAKSLDLAAYRQLRKPWVALFAALARGAAGAREWKNLFDVTHALTENREAFQEVATAGYGMLHDLLEAGQGGAAERIANLDLFPQLKSWAATLGLEGLRRLQNGLDEALKLQVRNVNLQLGFDSMAAGIMESKAK